MSKSSSIMAVLAAFAVPVFFAEPVTAQVSYLVTVDTTSLSGSGFLDFQFNPGVSSQAASASVSSFNPAVGLGAPVLAGNTSGTLPPSITLTNSSPYNDDFVAFTFGASIRFLVTLGGPAISSPNPSTISGSSFGFAMYSSDQVTPLLSTDPSGFAITINVNPNGTTTVNHFSTNADAVINTITQLGEAFVTNSGAGSVSVIDTIANRVKATTTVGLLPVYVAVSQDVSRAYVANSGANSVSVINTTTNAVIATVPVGRTPVQLAVTPDGSRVFVVNTGSDSVSVINAATNAVIATVSVGRTPLAVAISGDGTTALVTNTASGSVSVISTSTNTVIGTVPVSLLPSSIAAH